MRKALNFLITVSLAIFLSGCSHNLHYIGVWRSGSGSNTISNLNSWEEFISDGQSKASDQNLRLIDFEHYRDGTDQHFVGVWRSGSGNNTISNLNSWGAFISDGNTKAHEQGLRLIDFEYYESGGTRHYVGVWRSGGGNNTISNLNSWADFVVDGNIKTHEEGLRLIDFEYYEVDGTRHYVGVWRSGGGSNIISNLDSWDAFIADGNTKAHEEGLRLIDFEYYEVGGSTHYVGVWRSGSGSNTMSNEETWIEFVTDGNVKANDQGLRLIDFEVILENIDIDLDTKDVGPGVAFQPSCADLPRIPEYIVPSRNSTLIVDFTKTVDGKPRITIPSFDHFPSLPYCDDEIVFPNNICGFRVIGAARFAWLDDENNKLGLIESSWHNVYNSMSENSSLADLDDGVHYFDGIEFTGPIGACSTSNDGWNFPYPLTKNASHDPSLDNVRLVIEVLNGSIEFLNYNVRPESLDPHEFFEEADFEELIHLAETFEILEIREFIQNACEENPLHCPISESEKWW